jgi:hypothetical protein
VFGGTGLATRARFARNNPGMTLLLAMSRGTGRKVAEVGFLLLIIAGIWLAASQFQRPRWGVLRTVVAGFAIAAGGVLLLIAVHWGHFG